MSQPVPMTMRAIAEDVCARRNITLAELISHTRTKRVAGPRHEFMWLCRQVRRLNGHHRFSFPQIGRFLGGRDHSTVVHGARRYAERPQPAQEAA